MRLKHIVHNDSVSVRARRERLVRMSTAQSVRAVLHAGFAGSRSGALISTAWASMVHQGEEGYLRITDQMMKVLPPC